MKPMPDGSATPPPKILSLCVSMSKPINFQGRVVHTGIYKEPVQGRVALRALNLDGDEQADLTVHGGLEKALYTYASEHYPFWQEQLPDTKLPWGAFGENLTTERLFESTVCIGDEFRVGTAVIRVTQPRLPCYKLAIKIGRNDIVRRFIKSGRSGIYFSVVKEGVIAAGDELIYVRGDEHKVTVREVAELFIRKSQDVEQIERILNSNLAAQMKSFVAEAYRR
jgi:MOSC domain-containing protein YiiM